MHQENQSQEVQQFNERSNTMKKWLVGLVVAGLVFCNGSVEALNSRKTIIDAVTLDDDPTSVTSDVVNVYRAGRTGFFLDYDETEVGETLQAVVTIQTTYDGTSWFAGSFFDLGGGPTTFQTTETITGDSSYFFWLHADSNISRVRVVVTGANTDADDTILIDCFSAVSQ